MTQVDQATLDAVAKKAVRETLLSLGIDVNDPIQAQRDFQALRDLRKLTEDDEFSADLRHLRNWSKAVDALPSRGFLLVFTSIVTGGLGLLVLGFKEWIGK